MTRRGFFAMVAAAFAGRKAVAELRGTRFIMTSEVPPAERITPAQWREHDDPLAAFLSECCETGDGLQVCAWLMDTAYRAWCSEVEECAPLARVRFRKLLQSKGFRFNLSFWHGITLKPLSDLTTYAEWREQDQVIWRRLKLKAR